MNYKILLIYIFLIQWSILFIWASTKFEYITSTIPLFFGIYFIIEIYKELE